MTKHLQNKKIKTVLLALLLGLSGTANLFAQNITFADENVKAICVANWDTNGDGELNYAEAAAVTDLGEAFQGNSDITSFDELQYFIGLTSIGSGAFYGCTGLTSVEIDNSVTSIGEWAFNSCSGLTSIEIPNSVTYIGDAAFAACNGLTQIVVENGNSVYDSRDNCNAIIETATNSLIAGCQTTVIPSTVTSIGNYAFIDCYNLISIEIPNSVTSIEREAFYGCTGLTSVEIPNSVTSIGINAFSYCTGLTSVEIPNSVTSIGSWAFEGCSGLTSIEIPNSVTYIGDAAFAACNGLTQIVVENGNSVYDSRDNCNAIIETATNSLIAGCQTTVIPSTVTSIGNYAFFDCYNLISIEIPNSVTSIGNSAFGNCSALTSIEIPNSVTSIGNSAFGNCSALTSIEIPNSVTSIGSWAFEGCSGLTSIEIPNSVTSIGESAFAFCGGLTSIIVRAETPPALGDGYVFYNVPTDIPVLVPCGFEEAYTSISWGGFSNIHGMCDGTVTVAANPAEGGTVSGAGEYDYGTQCTVTATANEGYGFANWMENGSVVSTEAEYNFTVAGDRDLVANFVSNDPIVFADDNVKAICVANWDTDDDSELSYAEAAAVTNLGEVFQGNSDITSFDELQYFIGLTSIGSGAFSSCWELTSVEIPNTVTSIGNHAFQNCTGLTSVEIPNSVTSIGEYAFGGCTGLATMVVASGNTTYDSRDNCNAIIETATNTLVAGCKNTLIPNSVTSIGNGAFYYCSGLTSVEIPNSVTHIGESAFSGCSGLEQIVVGAENTVYDSRNNCNAIIETATNTLIAGCKNTVIPNSVTSIGYAAFTDCSGLTSVEIPNSVTSIGNEAFINCTGLTSVEIPNSVTSIGNYAFFNCTSLTSVEIPNSVTSIGNYAFVYCSGLTSVEIPNSVTSIGYFAFLGCTGLTEITMLRTDVPSLSYNVFANTNDCPIYVPYESLNNYKTASKWSNYASRIYPMAYTAVSGYSEGGGKWKFIASPLTEETEPTAVSNMTGTEYDLYRFNQSAELEWENYKVHDFDLVNEQGYLYANTEDVNLVFKGTFNEGSSQTITLIYDEGKDFAGWNLVGNPFPVQAYANRSYYTMNAAGTVIEPTAASTSTAIPACTGVMVKAETTGQSVTFSKTAPSAATNNGALQIAVAQANTRGAAVQDKAIVSFNAGDELGKFYFGESNAKLYIPQNGKELAIAYVCTDAARHVSTNEVPLNFKAEKNGEYTLSFDVANVIASEAKQSNLSEQFAYLHLIDNMNGADVDLLVSPEYTFNAKTSDYASRFRLVFSANESDGDNDGDNAFAFIDAGGNIVINGEGTLQMIDMMGRVVVCRDASNASAISTNGIPAGVYILRLINGNDVMTQKIVIE